MEKLKPVITHHFWILFLITLGLPPVAWWMTSGDLTVEIQAREEKLNGDFSGISNGSNIPNADWVQGVQQLIGVRKEQNRLALDRLWQAQMGLMNWPANVREYMEVCPYRGELEDQRIKEILPDLYRDDYQREVQRVWMLTEPVYEGGVRPDEGVPRKVSFPYAVMPQVREGKWDQLPPTWPEIWNSQEDLWLLSELFKAVQRVNAPTTGIVDSYVKRITQVELFGGDRITDDSAGDTSSESTAEPGGPAVPGAPGSMEGYPGGPPGMAGGRGFGAGTAGKGISIRTLPATFDLKEEFVVAGNNAGARGAMQPGFSSPDMMMPTAGGKANATESTEDADPDDSRYLSNVAAYRTRGFRLQVTIHQLQVPELIRELLNSKYPIEIIRFQQMALNPDETGAPGVSSGVPGRSMAGGVPGGPGYPGVGSATAGSAGKGSAASDEAANAEAAFDPTAFAGADGTGTADSSETTNVSIQTALRELDLVDLVVVGELYLYNPPILDADGDGVPDDPAETTAGDRASTQPETRVPGSTPLPGPGTTPAIPGTTPGVPGAIPVAPPGSVPSSPATTPATAAPGTVPAGVPGTAPPADTPGTTPPANTPGTTPPAATPTVPAPAVTPPAVTPPAPTE